MRRNLYAPVWILQLRVKFVRGESECRRLAEVAWTADRTQVRRWVRSRSCKSITNKNRIEMTRPIAKIVRFLQADKGPCTGGIPSAQTNDWPSLVASNRLNFMLEI